MKIEEAREWLKGNRSWTNMVQGSSGGDRAHEIACIARADAATTEQAYWIVRAYQEGLFMPETNDAKPVEDLGKCECGGLLEYDPFTESTSNIRCPECKKEKP